MIAKFLISSAYRVYAIALPFPNLHCVYG